MFIVLYGLTGEIGRRVRSHFDASGFKRMEKIYYSSSEEDITSISADGFSVFSTPDEIQSQCDYSYLVNNRLVGFNKKDFERAANGAEDIFTSVACSDIDFLKNLKADYGNYVTLIYVYIDDATLENVTLCYDESCRQQRLTTGRTLKHVYVDNPNLFDNIVLYGGEDSVFNEKNLLLQLDGIIERARSIEVKLNSQRKVALPYVGPDDYIFVSYSHRDKTKVEEKLHILQRIGFRLWYDTGIRGGDNWRKVLREKIKSSKNLIVFTSANSVKSEDVKIEIITADAFEKKIINVCLDNEIFDGTVGKIINDIHAVRANATNFEEQMIAALDKTTREPEKKP
ncbi:MAG: toll/interleukin-1 receptor domain-containing protein [Ruminococcaceae bacterium]|nr:toll/interleukin-1 receptor domain-containing protein [Oscillospiraceae bacterium]